MTKIMYRIILVYILMVLCGCEQLSEQEALAHKAMHRTIKTLEKRYGLRYLGRDEAGELGHYKLIGLIFSIHRVLSKEEGRKILIDSVEELLKEINGDPNLKPFLKPEIFTPANITMAIFSYQPDRERAYYPDIFVFSAQKGYVQYQTKIPEQKNGYYTDEREPYEEAVTLTLSKQ